jgi:hypothetical protein
MTILGGGAFSYERGTPVGQGVASGRKLHVPLLIEISSTEGTVPCGDDSKGELIQTV